MKRWLCVCLAPVLACSDGGRVQQVARAFSMGAQRPDELPRLVTSELPFRYPAAMYARKAQGNVTLHLFIDQDGVPLRDSTRVEESSGMLALDSAALRGAVDLRFVPARLRGVPVGITVLFPVYFRHPEARALPGDTILTSRSPAR